MTDEGVDGGLITPEMLAELQDAAPDDVIIIQGRPTTERTVKFSLPKNKPDHRAKRARSFFASASVGAPVGKTPKLPGRKTKRNEPCFCGSGKKYKKCCGKN